MILKNCKKLNALKKVFYFFMKISENYYALYDG